VARSVRANVAAMTDWVPLLITALGAGVDGSVITTYGSQARERRDARKEALSRMADADRVAGQTSSDRKALLDAGRAVGMAAILAVVPMYVVDTYLVACQLARDDRLKWAPQRVSPQDPASVGIHIYGEASALLIKVLWHPFITLPSRRCRSWRVRRFVHGVLPPGATIILGRTRGTKEWERAAIKAAKSAPRRQPIRLPRPGRSRTSSQAC
jgi:hypothetical protein